VFKEALKLKPDFIDAYKSLGQAYRCGFMILTVRLCKCSLGANYVCVCVCV